MGVYLDLPGFKSRTIIPPQDVDRIVRVRFDLAADAEASTVTPETKFGDVVSTGNVLTAILLAQSAIAHDASNYATFTIYKRTAGGAPTAIAHLTTQTTDIPAGVPVALTIDAAAITAEDVLTCAVAKAGTGVQLPALTIDVRPSPNFVESAIAQEQAVLEARLRKRYPIPLDAKGTVPEAVCRWLTRFVTRLCYGRRGFNPTSEQDAKMVLDMATEAEAEIKEAADSKDGLFDLPVAEGATPDVSGVTQGFPLGYSEASPYVAFDQQTRQAALEDSYGRGTGS